MAEIEKLEMRGISKSFFGKFANENVDFSIRCGEIVGLLGENGAGKTTLMNILYGLYKPDEGMIFVDGKQARFHSPKDALKAGIGMVHQHFMIVPSHTVLENLAAAYRAAPFFLPLPAVKRKLGEFTEKYGLALEPDSKAYTLSAGQLQRTEIVKALLNGANLLILDEPTSVLSPTEIEELFSVLKKMAEAGCAIVIISHKLEEILSLCSRVVVLRKGRVTGERPTAGADKTELARMMVGREIEFHTVRRNVPLGGTVLSVRDLSVMGERGETAVSGLSFEVRRSEIFGIAGVSGNGQRELAEAITGLRKSESGRILVNGKDATNRSAARLHEGGISHIPEERMRFGIVPNLCLYENAVLKRHRSKDFSRKLFLDYSAIKAFAERLVARFDVSAPSIRVPPRNLSGGNIQKLILGRELSAEPSFLVAAHPTYGLDVGATEYVRGRIRELKASGGAVLLLSEDLEEIFELSDTIAVIFKGKFMGVVERDSADITKIGLMMAGVAS